MEDMVDLAVEEERLRQIVADEHEVIAMRAVLDVLQRPGVEVVDADRPMARRQ
jgi:hypothetical protein